MNTIDIKALPHDTEIEESLLSATLVDSSILGEVADILSPRHLYLIRMSEAPLAVNAIYYAQKINNLAVRRQLVYESARIQAVAFDTSKDIEDVVENAQKRVLRINTYSNPEYVFTNDLVVETIDRYEEIHKEKTLVTGVPTGFGDLDRVLCGMQTSDLLILAGRPSMGKTALALQFSKGASDAGYKPFIFSLEQPQDQLMDRLFAAQTRMPTTVFRSGFWSNDDWKQIAEGAGELTGVNIGIDDRGGQSYRDICKTARIVHKKHGVNLIIIDHLGLVTGAAHKSRNDEIGIYTRYFKALAKELRIPVVALSQLSRKVEERSNKRPQLSDLRDSGNVEQDADVVMFIYRDEVYDTDENNPNKGKAELIIAKQRQGPVCTIYLSWLAKCTRFEQYHKEQY
ncbi:MAG: replicative DNA helicase [Deltaproteobacteria bacterium]|nr:replicative DNA helicase [Deltaproteobacteria bacterium]